MINRRLLPGINSLFYESHTTRVSPSAPIYSVSSLLSCIGEILSGTLSPQLVSSNLSNRVTTQASSQYDAGLVSQIIARFTTESRLDALIISSSILNAAVIIEGFNEGLNFGSNVLLSKTRLDNIPKVVSNSSNNINCVISVSPQEILQAINLSSNLTSIVTLTNSAEVIAFLEHIGDEWELQIKGKNWNIFEDGQSWTITLKPSIWNIKKNSIATTGN